VPARIYPSARERILDAAERLILKRGINQLSIEVVIREAQISKGGFFHHFATKDALLVSILDRLIDRVSRQIAELATKDPEPRGARLRAQIALAFEEAKIEASAPRALLLAFLEAASSQPAVSRRARELNADVLSRDVAEDIPEGRAIAIQFALDGFFLAQAFGSARLSAAQIRSLRDTLLALARPEVSARRKPRRSEPSKKGRRT
jgi:AcrR family transcriptional regulator